jgi:hypothetical protein
MHNIGMTLRHRFLHSSFQNAPLLTCQEKILSSDVATGTLDVLNSCFKFQPFDLQGMKEGSIRPAPDLLSIRA